MNSFYMPKVVAITGHKSEYTMNPKTLEKQPLLAERKR